MPDFLVQTLAILKGNVVPALIVLTVVVFVHEMGHFLIARWCGIRVAAFSIGFGRELAGFTDRRGTRWKLSAIPLGGYVRFEGDENAASFPDPETLARTPPAERRGLFHFAPVWKRAAVVAAGPVANFILAILVFAAVFTLLGRPHILPVAETVISGSAAERAGLRPGDRILAVDGSEIDSFSELQSIVMLSADDPLEVVVDRGGERVLLTATPERQEKPDGLGGTHRTGVLGITAGEVDFRKDAPLPALRQGVSETYLIIDRTLTFIGRLVRGRESAEQLSGPIGVGKVAGVVASSGGLPGLIYLTAVLSVSIGLFNLFPVPMLDGGHLVFYAIEALRGRPLSPRLQDLGFRVGFALVIMLFIFVTFNDIVNLS
ncbi:MAG: RIP metalloprotease RseP [Rhizobiales bacterium]|nr:RIP metalloprotease RseP [Hyphomicrobiales bacterium]